MSQSQYEYSHKRGSYIKNVYILSSSEREAQRKFVTLFVDDNMKRNYILHFPQILENLAKSHRICMMIDSGKSSRMLNELEDSAYFLMILENSLRFWEKIQENKWPFLKIKTIFAVLTTIIFWRETIFAGFSSFLR